MKSTTAKEEHDHISLFISFSGWLILLAYLYRIYLDSGRDIISLIASSEPTIETQYTLLILFAPLISSILGYIVNKRIVRYKEQYLKEVRFKDLAENELLEIINSLIFAFVNALDAKSPWTMGHSMRVRHYSLLLAAELDVSDEDLQFLDIAALLHDIGKIGTYDDILNKVGELTEDEYNLIKMHPGHAVQILSPIKKFKEILPIVKHHHERLDGRGYPDGIANQKIPFLARILCVADAYDAITSERPYKSHMLKDDAVREVVKKAGTQFDPDVVSALVKIHKNPEFDAIIEKSRFLSEAQKTSAPT
ncbi:MAG: HD domain-containing protein [Desulfuromonadales bacterium]|nr:HD domain-containing protein [Desulfuromonadales bacterium]